EWDEKRMGGLGKVKREEAPQGPRQEPEPPATEEAPRQYRKTLAAGPKADDFDRAFVALSKQDPAAVAEFLVASKDVPDPYATGSAFAVLCGKDREKHFKALLGAKEPYVRVAGAVYLCYENEEAGVAALKKLTELE